MEKINYGPIILAKLERMTSILFDKEYFGFISSAENYVQGITDFINTIPSIAPRKTKNKKYGRYYARYVVKKQTYTILYHL